MQFIEHFNLKQHNTFGFPVEARWFCEVHNEQDLQEALDFSRTNQLPLLLLGGGSNVLFTKNWDGLLILIRIMGKSIVRETNDEVWVKAGAGENWHELVMWTIDQGLGGLENLSLIPGCCGAAPMQNIGAYGVELKDVFEELSAFHLEKRETVVFSAADCRFGYRESVFKQECKGQYVITSITLKLSRNPILRLSYGDISSTLKQMGITSPGIREVSQAVMFIRNKKLPNPLVVGNAGSFFKNPVVSRKEFEVLSSTYPDMPHFTQPDGVKIPAAWLIEQCGWKGKFFGNVGVNQMQPLVLVNFGFGRGEEILALSQKIRASVLDRFQITLTPEVNII